MVRVLVVGAGWFASSHLEGWHSIATEVVGICDLDSTRAEGLAHEFGVAHSGSHADQMMDALHPDIVDVVLPPKAQRETVTAALARGIPTICQKPFGEDMADAEAMAYASEQARTPLVIHENFRFAPWFREARQLIDAGVLGRVHGVTFRLRPGDGQGADAYLSRQPYFRTMPQLLIRETAIHYIDSFRYLLGNVSAVTARLRRLNPAIAGEDAGVVLLEFDDQRTGLFDGNRLNDHPASDTRRTLGEMWLEGEAGVLRLDGDAQLWWKPHGLEERLHMYDTGRGAFGGAVSALQRHVLANLTHGAPLENSARDYLENLRVQTAVYLSHASGRRIEMRELPTAAASPR